MAVKPRRLAAIVALAVVAVGCVSDPSPNRVAEDLINTLATTEEERECMLEVLEEYDVNELGMVNTAWIVAKSRLAR